MKKIQLKNHTHQPRKNSLGAALLEVIVAIGIVTLVMTTIVSLVTVSLKSASLAQQKNLGTKYSQEGLESLRQMRNILGWDGFLATLRADGTTIHYCLSSVPTDATSFAALQNAPCTSSQFVDPKNIFQRQADITIATVGSRTSIAITVRTYWDDGGFQKQSIVYQQFEEYNLADAPNPVVFSPFPYQTPNSSPVPSLLPSVPPSIPPSGGPWTFRKPITVTNSTTAVQTNFQVPVTVDTASLLGTKMSTGCADIRITAADGITKLPFWLEPNTCGTGVTKVWVKVPTLALGANTLYLYYGANTALSESTATSNVFVREISNVVGAWDMDESGWNGTAGEAKDTSGNSNDGKSTCSGSGCGVASTVAGLFKNAGNFTNTGVKTNYLTIPDKGSGDSLRLNGSKNLSVGGWINSSLSALSPVFSKYDSLIQGYILYVSTQGKLVISFNGDLERHGTTSSVVPPNAWTYVTVVYSGGNTLKLYANGALKQSFTIGSTSLNDYPGTATIGTVSDSIGNPAYSTPGKLDDVRVYSGALTGAEISDHFGPAAGTREGYVTLNYPGKELIRQYGNVTSSVGAEQGGSWPGL